MTLTAWGWHDVPEISIHTPLAGSDFLWDKQYQVIVISIHTPLAGSDLTPPVARTHVNISIHTTLAGSDVVWVRDRHRSREFQSTLPLRGVTGGNLVGAVLVRISIHTPLAGRDAYIRKSYDFR